MCQSLQFLEATEDLCLGLLGPRSFLFLLLVLSLTHVCCKSCIFKTFLLSFHGSNHLDDPSLFEAYIRPPIVTFEHN